MSDGINLMWFFAAFALFFGVEKKTKRKNCVRIIKNLISSEEEWKVIKNYSGSQQQERK